MDKPHANTTRYEATAYDLREITTRTMTRQQIAEIEYRQYDHFMSGVLGIWGHRTTDGVWIEYKNGGWPGIGNTGLRIMQAIQLHPGEFLTPAEIAELTGYDTLRRDNNLSARLKALRDAHKETFSNPSLFLSKRPGFGIAWNAQKTWMWVERISVLSNEHSRPEIAQIGKEVEL